MLDRMKDEFVDTVYTFVDFFVSIYEGIIGFLSKYMDKSVALLLVVMVGFLILMIILTKVIRK